MIQEEQPVQVVGRARVVLGIETREQVSEGLPDDEVEPVPLVVDQDLVAELVETQKRAEDERQGQVDDE